MELYKNMDGIENAIKNNNKFLEEVATALDQCNIFNTSPSPKYVYGGDSEIAALQSAITTINNQAINFADNMRNAVMIIDAADAATPNLFDENGNMYTPNGELLIPNFNMDQRKTQIINQTKDQGILKSNLYDIYVQNGFSPEEAKKYSEMYGKNTLKEEIILAGEDISDSVKDVADNVKGVFDGTNSVWDACESVFDLGKKIKYTETVVGFNIAAGVGKTFEGMIDYLGTVDAKIESDRNKYYASTADMATKQKIEEEANKQYKEKVDDIKYDYVGSWRKDFFENNPLGKEMNENSFIRYNDAIGDFSYIMGQEAPWIAINIATGGKALPYVALARGVSQGGKKAEYAAINNPDISPDELYSTAASAALWEGAQTYIGGKVNIFTNGTGPFGVVVDAASEGVVGFIDPFVNAAIDTIADTRDYKEIFNDNYGGISGAAKNAGYSAAFDLGYDALAGGYSKLFNMGGGSGSNVNKYAQQPDINRIKIDPNTNFDKIDIDPNTKVYVDSNPKPIGQYNTDIDPNGKIFDVDPNTKIDANSDINARKNDLDSNSPKIDFDGTEVKNEIVKNIDSDLSPITKARQAYIELNKRVNYDDEFFWGVSNPEGYLENIKNVSFSSLEGPDIVCTSWANLYRELLIESGFNPKDITIHNIDDSSNKHSWVEVKLDNGNILIADATEAFNSGYGKINDLTNNKTGNQTVGFVELDSKYQNRRLSELYNDPNAKNDIIEYNNNLREIDKELNYTNGDLYSDENILKADTYFDKNTSPDIKLEDLPIPENMDGIEAYSYYRQIDNKSGGDAQLINYKNINSETNAIVITKDNKLIVYGKNSGKKIFDLNTTEGSTGAQIFLSQVNNN